MYKLKMLFAYAALALAIGSASTPAAAKPGSNTNFGCLPGGYHFVWINGRPVARPC